MGRMSLHQHATWPQAPQMRMPIFALEQGRGCEVQHRTHAQAERRGPKFGTYRVAHATTFSLEEELVKSFAEG